MTMNCEAVRDAYPNVINGSAAPAVVEAVRAHLSSCDECRAECALLDIIHAQPVVVPSGLHERVIAGVANARAPRRFRVSDIAMAATLAAALIGGAIITRQTGEISAPATVNTQPQTIGSISVEDALLTGKASLDDLSVEQLEQLLGEIES
jgi:predicted anti-sigma-YlaC factor YlaD